MPNNNRNKVNQPPTGEGKKQRASAGEPNKLSKRSTVLQAQRNHPEENIGSSSEEEASRSNTTGQRNNPKRQKAGR